MRRIYYLLILLLASITNLFSQEQLKILFIGNSYTFGNDLPGILQKMIKETGDSAIVESAAVGGYYLKNHASDPTTIEKIKKRSWDYVIIQEQSQLPALSEDIINNESKPYLLILDSIIKSANTCTEKCFYMTWGRKFGDSANCNNFPDLCTYEGMDSLLRLRYVKFAEETKGIVSPVGAVWNYLRKYNPEIELYVSDNSHPAFAGSLAAAYTFYSVLFRKNPYHIKSYSAAVAELNDAIKKAVHEVVYRNPDKWFVGKYDPLAAFSYIIDDDKTIIFENNSLNGDKYHWDFGDGTISEEPNPTHKFESYSEFEVKLTVTKCKRTDSIKKNIIINSTGISENNSGLFIYPNPSEGLVNINTNIEENSNFSYQVNDLMGNILINENISRNKHVINLSKYPRGLYLIYIKDNKNILNSYKILLR